MSKIGSAASEQKSFENVDGLMHGWTHDEQKVIIIAHPEHSSDELKQDELRKLENEHSADLSGEFDIKLRKNNLLKQYLQQLINQFMDLYSMLRSSTFLTINDFITLIMKPRAC